MSSQPAPAAQPRDLEARRDVHDLVVGFYREIVFDDLLEPVFGEVAEVDWSVHIPRLIDYWCRILLGEPGYEGNLLAAHQHVHDLDPFRAEHVDRWYALWAGSVDAGWAGPVAEQAKRHAERIARSIARRLVGTAWRPPNPAPPSTAGAAAAVPDPATAVRHTGTGAGTARHR